MHYLLKGYFTAITKTLLFSTLLTLPIAAIINSVIYNDVTVFLSLWKWTYLLFVVLNLTILLVTFTARVYVGLRFSKKFQATFSEVLEAHIQHKLFFRNNDHKTWTAKEFKEKLEAARIPQSFDLEDFIKTLRGE